MKAITRSGVLSLLVLVLFFSGSVVFGQERSEDAFLVRQVQQSAGVPVLPANRLPVYSAAYEIGGSVVDVYVLGENEGPGNVDFPGDWELSQCADPADALQIYFLQGSDASVPVVWAAVTSGYTAVLRGDLGQEAWCSFLAVFRDRFGFFLEALGDDRGIPLPAILPGVRLP